MIRDRISGNEIRVVTSSEIRPSANGPVTINEFFNGINTGFLYDAHSGFNPRRVIDGLLADERITAADHLDLTIQIDKAQRERAEKAAPKKHLPTTLKNGASVWAAASTRFEGTDVVIYVDDGITCAAMDKTGGFEATRVAADMLKFGHIDAENHEQLTEEINDIRAKVRG